MTVPTYELITDKVGWARIYFSKGDKSPGVRVNEVIDPPFPGWGHVIIMDGEKSCTIFCPFSFRTFSVSHRSMEYASLSEGHRLPTAEELGARIKTKWLEWAALGVRADFGMAAVVLKNLGFEAPAILEIAKIDLNEPPANRKGKELGEKLLKPVKMKSKRGQVLQWFLADGGGPKPIQAAMAEFDTTRSNILSHLFMLNKDHGIGYHLSGNTATVQVPEGVDPFGE